MKEIIIGTRGSILALWQANFIKNELAKFHIESKIKIIKTTGDKILDAPLAKIGGKGLFTKELEEQLLNNTINLAVHSLKDVPVLLPKGLKLAAITKREYKNDCFLSIKFSNLKSLPNNAKIGTTSLRRAMQIKSFRSDLDVFSLRGNVQSRLEKLKNGTFDAIILAEAALKRLEITSENIHFIEPLDFMIPAFGQGALGIECKSDCEFLNILEQLNHKQTQIECEAEREFVRLCNGGCQVPMGVNAMLNGRILTITAILGLPNGTKILKEKISGDIFPKNCNEISKYLPNTQDSKSKILNNNSNEILNNLSSEVLGEILKNAKNLAQNLYKILEKKDAKDILNQALVMLEDYFG